jgi:hypothetical protein
MTDGRRAINDNLLANPTPSLGNFHAETMQPAKLSAEIDQAGFG